MTVLDETRVVKDDKAVDPEGGADALFDVTAVENLVVIGFVEVAVLEVKPRTELEALVLVMSNVAVRVLAEQDLILVLLEAGVEDDGVALEDSHGLA